MVKDIKNGVFTHIINVVNSEITKQRNIRVDEVIETFIVTNADFINKKYVEVFTWKFGDSE